MDRDDNKAEAGSRNPRVVVDFEMLRQFAASNFRDLGGHPVRGGGRVRLLHIFRSAHLAEIPLDSPMRALALKTLITLQSRVEVHHLGRPVLLESGLRWEHIPIGDTWFTDEGFERIDVEPGREHLSMVLHFPENWRRFFKLLTEREAYPVLFHCSAGRDRTGVGAAMLLELLGVDRERVLRDFLESNVTFSRMPLTPDQIAPLFEAIDEYGGIDAFMREAIGLEPGEPDSIRKHLIEG